MPLFLPLDVLFLDATHGALTAETALTTFNPVSRLACETYTNRVIPHFAQTWDAPARLARSQASEEL